MRACACVGVGETWKIQDPLQDTLHTKRLQMYDSFPISTLLTKNLKIKIYRTLIPTVVLYGCETWSLTLREERRLRVFENRVLRRIFGPRRNEVIEEWRKLHNEELIICTAHPVFFG